MGEGGGGLYAGGERRPETGPCCGHLGSLCCVALGKTVSYWGPHPPTLNY